MRVIPENIITALFFWVMAVLLLDCFKLYYEVAYLVSEIEWTVLLVLLGLAYRSRPKKNWITIMFVSLCLMQIWTLMDAAWVTWMYIIYRHLPLVEVDALIYENTHSIHLAGYWILAWIPVVALTTTFLIYVSNNKK